MECGIPNGVRRASIPGVGCQSPSRTKKACIWWGWRGHLVERSELEWEKDGWGRKVEDKPGTSNARKYAYI